MTGTRVSSTLELVGELTSQWGPSRENPVRKAKCVSGAAAKEGTLVPDPSVSPDTHATCPAGELHAHQDPLFRGNEKT